MSQPNRQTQLGRIGEVLNYIHLNLDQPLAVSSLAERAGWSRWQFNRVFSDQTGQPVGQYIRELRLSLAAEMLLFTRQRVIDIGLASGFGSDVSFTRSFTRHFGCPPAQYRRRGLPCLLTTPLCSDPALLPPDTLKARIPTIRLDSRPAFEVTGKADRVRGLFSDKPNFGTRVPELWRAVNETDLFIENRPRIGVLDLSRGPETEFTYLAGAETNTDNPVNGEHRLQIPAQNYVIVSFHGPLSSLADMLRWFFRAWLPHAGCKAVYGFDLEVYPAGFEPLAAEVSMEYWIPVTLSEPLIARYAPIG